MGLVLAHISPFQYVNLMILSNINLTNGLFGKLPIPPRTHVQMQTSHLAAKEAKSSTLLMGENV